MERDSQGITTVCFCFFGAVRPLKLHCKTLTSFLFYFPHFYLSSLYIAKFVFSSTTKALWTMKTTPTEEGKATINTPFLVVCRNIATFCCQAN
jgi:hypothetical protein